MDFRILIVEDEARLREVVCDYFRSRGDTPFEAENGLRALELIEDAEFDAVLLDIMMPELDGLSVCRALRRDNDVPIILLTALSDEEDKLLGYELGADDYVTKPFSLSVLYAKTAALIKSSRRQVLTGGRMEAGGIVLEDSTRRVWAGGRELANWRRIEERLHCDVYFTDPYCAWQKGTNENLNGLLREFYPKGRNLSRVAPATLKRNLALINARPRKVLNFHSAQELWDFELNSCCT